MTVLELKTMLNNYPDDMDIVNSRCSDYEIIKLKDWCVVKGVRKDWWVMRSHQTMCEYNKAEEKEYLHLEGN